MKLRNPEYMLDIKIELAEGGFHVTAPVVLENQLAGLGLETGVDYRMRKFVVTSKKELLKLIDATVEDLYQ